MVYATCLNEECSKDEWWLKKPPAEYASGGPKCPECGTTRVEIGGEPDAPSEGESVEQSGPEARPAKTAEAEAGGGGGALDTHEDAIQTGAQVGELVSGLRAESPEEQAETQGKLMTALGSTVASMGQQLASQRKEDLNRSKNADESNIAAVDDYISCPECGTQITDLPEPGAQFRCPGCNQLLESR